MTYRMNSILFFPKLTNDLDAKTYSIEKIYVWDDMLKRNMKPIKFFNPTKKGTKVQVEQVLNEQEHTEGLKELERFARNINKRHGTCFKFMEEVGV